MCRSARAGEQPASPGLRPPKIRRGTHLLTPVRVSSCSYVIPHDSGGVLAVTGGTKPTVWNANCGNAFGHELTFSKTLKTEPNQVNNFEVVKNARGGTNIHQWYGGRGGSLLCHLEDTRNI